MDERKQIEDTLLRTLRALDTPGINDDPVANAEMIGGLTVLIGGALADLRVIANAVEKLTKFEITKVGEILQAGVPEGAHEIGLTMAEYQTVMALRAGEVQVVVNPLSGNDAGVAAWRMEQHPESLPPPWSELTAEQKQDWRMRYNAEVLGKGL